MDNVDLPERCEENPQTYAAFHIREHRQDRIFSTENGEEFLDTAFLLSRYLQQDAAEVRKDFSQFFYNSTDIMRKQFDEFCVLRMENAGQVAGAFEIDLDAGWCSALNIADGWVTFRIKDVADAVLEASKIPGNPGTSNGAASWITWKASKSASKLLPRWKPGASVLCGRRIFPSGRRSSCPVTP